MSGAKGLINRLFECMLTFFQMRLANLTTIRCWFIRRTRFDGLDGCQYCQYRTGDVVTPDIDGGVGVSNNPTSRSVKRYTHVAVLTRSVQADYRRGLHGLSASTAGLSADEISFVVSLVLSSLRTFAAMQIGSMS